jgi:hypothetical protein
LKQRYLGMVLIKVYLTILLEVWSRSLYHPMVPRRVHTRKIHATSRLTRGMLDLSFTFATLRIGLKSENSVFEKNLNLTNSKVLLPPGGIAI